MWIYNVSFNIYKTQLLKRDLVSFVDLLGQVNSGGYVRDVTNRCENCAVGGGGKGVVLGCGGGEWWEGVEGYIA